MKKVLVAILMLLPIVASAYDVEVDGIYYNINSKVNSAEVTKGDKQYAGNITIPEAFVYENISYKVTSIGDYAFSSCLNLLSITFPNSIEKIGSYAFQYCSQITNVVIPSSTKTIGWYAFIDCSKLESVTLSEGVESMGHGTFLRCTNLRKIEIPSSITKIEAHSFMNCKRLTNMKLPNSIIIIEGSAFSDCENLLDITLPNSITEIGESAFEGCVSLKEIILPTELSTIGSNLFKGCISLNSIMIPSKLRNIAWGSFYGCRNLTSITMLSYSHVNNYAFADCVNLKDFYCYSTEPPFVEGDEAFQNAYIDYATLHVPSNSVINYQERKPWSDFGTIIALSGEAPDSKKCEVPTISYTNGKLTFTCETDGAECVATISDADIKTHYGNEVSLTATYTVSVYAAASGYENSDIATATLCWIDAAPKTEGIENGVAQVRANAVLIQSHDGTLSIAGVADGTDIAVYSISGQMVGSAKANGATSSVTTTLRSGNIAIVRIADKSVKVVMQ